MQSFSYCNPTRLIFGKDAETKLIECLSNVGSVKKVMLIYGGESAKKSGLLDRVVKESKEAGLRIVLKGGVRPNPTIEFIREAIDKARRSGIDAVLALGGGSVIDTAKTVAAGYSYAGDAWDFFTGKATPEKVLPIATLLTIPAAGSEQSIRAVVSNGEEKKGMGNEKIRPTWSAINPEIFFTLPKNQIAAGVFDMMSHIFERYFTNTSGVDFTSASAEAALRVIMRNAPKLIENPEDYDAWSQVGLAGSFAHNGFYGLGHEEDWACHGMEHALSGVDPKITHGAGLAILTPAWMRYVWSSNPERFMRFATEVMQVQPQASEEETILMAIAKLCSFIGKMGLPLRLSQVTGKALDVEKLVELSLAKGSLGFFMKLSKDDVRTIFTSVMD